MSDHENNDFYSRKLNAVSTKKNTTQPSESKWLQLRFLNSNGGMPAVVHTGLPIGGELEASMEVVLVDGLTGNVVKSGSEASEEVEILVLDKAFNKNYMDDWTSEEYESYIHPGRQEKTTLLRTTRIRLTEGRGSLSHIVFSHTKNPLPKIEVRLGARIVRAMDSSNGTRIREAISEPFTVKDRRGMNKKDYRLSLIDQVSRLRNIGRKSLKKLRSKGIRTVKDLLARHRKDPQELKHILGNTISPRELQDTINHAKACELHMRKNPEAKHDAPEMVSDIHKVEASVMEVSSINNMEGVHVNDVSSFPVANSNGIEIIDSMNAYAEPFDTLGLESTSWAFHQDELLWHQNDTETIYRALCENEHQQFFDPFDPFQSNTFCSPADLKNVLQEFKAKTQKGWKLLFSIQRWFSVRRIVARKPIRGIKQYRQEQMFCHTTNASAA